MRSLTRGSLTRGNPLPRRLRHSLRRSLTALVVMTAVALLPGVRSAQAQPRTWQEQDPADRPSPRYASAITFDAARGHVVMFGGGNGMIRRDMWTWDGTTWAKISLPGNVPKPEGRIDSAMAYDGANGDVVLFGGRTRSGVVGDTWTWNGTAWAQESPADSPGARAGFAMVYDEANGEVLLVGGVAADGSALGDTWTWDGSTWTNRAPDGSPPARHRAAMVYDEANGEVLLVGGVAADGSALGDTWTWDGSTWTNRAPDGSPSPRSGAVAAYDGANGDVVLFGGSALLPNDELWSWDGSTWREVNTPRRPSARSDAAMVFDGANDQVVVFGGRDPKSLNDTWTLMELTPVEGINLGGGKVSGVVQLAGDGIPPLGETCRATTFDLEAVADTVTLNTVLTQYVGPVTVTGSGASVCEDVGSAAGSLELVASGDGAGGTRVDCGPLRGQYTRVLADVTAILTGPCIINEFATGDVSFAARVVFQPTQGDGVTTPVTAGAFDGAFAVAPD